MKDVYPKQMEIEYDTEYKTILTMYDEKGNKRNQMIIYHIFNGLEKSNDYNQMKRDALNGKRAYFSIVTVGDEYIEQGYVYLKYSLEDDTHSDTGYNFPFAVKAYITDDAEIIGDLQKEKNVKVQYKNSNAPLDELKITLIKVNDYKCYSINDFLSPYNLMWEHKNEYDIEKETGLVRKAVLDEQNVTREYEFENVDDSIFIEPDISQYTLKEND